MNQDLINRILSLSDSELVEMVKQSDEYRPEAIEFAQSEITRRGGSEHLVQKNESEIGSEEKFVFDTRNEGQVIVTDKAIITSDRAIIARYQDLIGVSWKHLVTYYNTAKGKEDLVLHLWHKEGGKISLASRLKPETATVQFEVKDFFKKGRIREKFQNEKIETRNKQNNFYEIAEFIGTFTLPFQYKNLKSKLESDGEMKLSSNLRINTDLSFTYSGTIRKYRFDIHDIKDISVQRGFVHLAVTTENEIKDFMIGLTEEVFAFHLLQYMINKQKIMASNNKRIDVHD